MGVSRLFLGGRVCKSDSWCGVVRVGVFRGGGNDLIKL